MKTRNTQITFFEMFKSFYNFDTFTKVISQNKLILGNILFLFLIFILTIISSQLTYQYQSISSIFTTIIIGVPLFFLAIFSFIYLFLSAYEIPKQTFSKSFLRFSFLTLGFVLLGNTISLVKTISQNNFLTIVTSTLLFLTVFYYIFNITQNMKNYFRISWQRMFLTQIITYLILSLTIVTYWINILITSLK
jgi:hypothetical protein